MRMLRVVSLALALALVSSCGGTPRSTTTGPGPNGAQEFTPPVEPPPQAPGPAEPALPLWSQVKRGTLANGLTYYIMPHHKPEQRASLWLAVNAGALQEDDDQRGLAHFVEHMAFNGTAKYGKQAIIDYLEKIGMEFGPDVNAYTSFDETVYQLQVPTDDPSYVATGLDILREWAGNISFEAVEVDKERGVVLEEWRLGKGPFERIFDQQVPVIFGGTRYAQRLPIGKPEILKAAPKDALVRYYRDWYRPDLMAVMVVGDVDPKAIEAAITARFGDLRAPATPRPRTTGGALDTSGTKIAIHTDRELPRAMVSVQNLFPRRGESTLGHFREYVIDSLYHTMLRARLAELGRRPEAPYSFAFSATGSETREFEVFQRGAMAKDGQLAATLSSLLAEVLRVERHGFTATEFERAKRETVQRTEQSAAEWDKEDAYSYVDEMTRNFFEGEFMIGRQAEHEHTARFVAEITLAEVNAAARSWGGASNRAVLIAAPASAKGVPTKAEVEAILAAAEKTTLEPWVDTPPPAALMATAPTPGAIEAESTIAEVGVTEWRLANGARVVIKPTTFDNQTVSLSINSIGGTALVPDRDFDHARAAVEAATAGGVGALSDGDLDRLMQGHSVMLFPWLSEQNEGMWAQSSVADLELLLQLVHLRLGPPRRDPVAFEAWRQAQITVVERRDAVPETAFGDRTRELMSGGHLRRKPVTAAALRAVDLDRALAIYRDRFGDVSDFTFVFTGNVDVAALRPLVETYLASLPGKRKPEKRKDLGVKPPKGKLVRTFEFGSEPKARFELTFHADERWSKDAERDLGILGDVLAIRLREILREDMGGVYGVGAWGWLSRATPQRRSFSIRFGCAPENVEALRAAVFTEIARLQKEGVTQDYLDKVKAARRRAFETDTKTNDWWVNGLTSAYEWGDDPREMLSIDSTLARVTNANVIAAARRYLSDKQYFLGVMKPVAAQPAATP